MKPERGGPSGGSALCIFHDRTLAEIARARPGELTALAAIGGVGQAKLDRYR